MKATVSKKIVLAAIFPLSLMMVPTLFAQTPKSGGQQLQSPVVIPAARGTQQATAQGQTYTATTTVTATAPIATNAQPVNMPLSVPASTGAALTLSNDLSASASNNVGKEQSVLISKPQRDGLTDAQRAEMVARMRKAVEQVAAEYGNPTFAQVFTNDQVQAQVLRKRIQMLQRVENIQSEIATLDKQKQQAQQDLASTRREMIVLQDQADALTTRIQKARRALDLASQ